MIGPLGACIDPSGHTILQDKARTFSGTADMSVNIEQPRDDKLAACIDGLACLCTCWPQLPRCVHRRSPRPESPSRRAAGSMTRPLLMMRSYLSAAEANPLELRSIFLTRRGGHKLSAVHIVLSQANEFIQERFLRV